jgi:hypothetical protein
MPTPKFEVVFDKISNISLLSDAFGISELFETYPILFDNPMLLYNICFVIIKFHKRDKSIVVVLLTIIQELFKIQFKYANSKREIISVMLKSDCEDIKKEIFNSQDVKTFISNDNECKKMVITEPPPESNCIIF